MKKRCEMCGEFLENGEDIYLVEEGIIHYKCEDDYIESIKQCMIPDVYEEGVT